MTARPPGNNLAETRRTSPGSRLPARDDGGRNSLQARPERSWTSMGLFGFVAHLVLCGLHGGAGPSDVGRAPGAGPVELAAGAVGVGHPAPSPRAQAWVRRAPDFALPAAGLRRVRLRDFTGRTILLVFADDPGDLLPELNRLQRRGEHQVLLVRNSTGDGHEGIPVLRQTAGSLSRRYESRDPLRLCHRRAGPDRREGAGPQRPASPLPPGRGPDLGRRAGPADDPPAGLDAEPATARLRDFRPRRTISSS